MLELVGHESPVRSGCLPYGDRCQVERIRRKTGYQQ